MGQDRNTSSHNEQETREGLFLCLLIFSHSLCNTRGVETQTNMNQQSQVFHLCQYTERHGHQVIHHLTTNQWDADYLADQYNQSLANRGIPGSVCSWYVTGPHQNTSGFN